MNISSMTFEGFAHLDHLSIIQAEGADAVSFLHGQLTQDVALLDMQHARLAALCSAKGRMLASFVLFKTSPERVLLMVSKDLLATTLQRLSMFMLRAKCKLTDVSDQFHLIGASGQAVTDVGCPSDAAWQLWSQGSAQWVSLYPANGCQRALGLLPTSEILPNFTQSADQWHLSEVLSGVATLTQPIAEAFVPQMLNYESVGGVSFKKGCYPGQEIVARSQFRGTLKRRAYLAYSDASVQIGQEIFPADDPSQPCGLVAQAAPFEGGSCAILSIQTASAASLLVAGSTNGSPVQLLSLPYPLMEDI